MCTTLVNMLKHGWMIHALLNLQCGVMQKYLPGWNTGGA
jgi:hypothetical protein